MSDSKKRSFQKLTLGSIVRIPLDETYHTYGMIVPDAGIAVFDSRSKTTLSLDEILSKEFLFIVGVYNSAITKGRWEKIYKNKLPNNFQVRPPQFIQDPFKPEQFSIYENGEIRPAILEECIGLERCAIWEAEHIESRIQDHYAGKDNIWVESLKIKPVE